MFKIIESLQAVEKAVNYFRKKLHHRCLTGSEIRLSLFVFRFFCLGSCQISMMEYFLRQFPVGIYLLKVSNESTSANLTKWSNTPTICRQQPTNCLGVFNHFVGLALASFWCLYYCFWTYFTPCSIVSIANFEHVIAGWVVNG